MADVNNTNSTDAQGTTEQGTNASTQTSGTDTTQGQNVDSTQPSVEELMAQLAAEKAARAKDKASFDKTAHDLAETKKALRAKQSQQEIEDEAKAEAEKKMREDYENAIAELNHMKAVNAYKSLDAATVETLISAVTDNDHEAIATFIDAEKAKAVKEAKAEWIKTRPETNVGDGGSQMSMDEIMAVKDATERQKLIAQNLAAFQS